MVNKKRLDIIAELGIIVAAINLGFFMEKSFQGGPVNLFIALIILVLALWLKNS